jgi:hypothetical protein
VAVVEHASKLHLKSVLRWLLRRQEWNPFDPAPLEFVELNFDFHPAWMRRQFEAAGLKIKNIRALSYYRLALLKRLLPTALLVTLDSWAQPTGNWWQLSPSLFLQAQAQKKPYASAHGFFRCPVCKSSALSQPKPSPGPAQLLICQGCQRGWAFKDGIYDFKTPLPFAANL